MQSRVTGGGVETLNQERGRSVAVVDGCGKAQELVGFGVDQIEVNIPAQD
jgi:hypothetical protein